MENNNNIDKYFRKLSEEQEPKPFKNMDAIWDKVEEKLDQKKKKRIIPFWQYFEIKSGFKYVSMAAAVLLLITFGSRFINNNPNTETTESETEKIVLVDNEKIQEEFDSLHDSDVVALELAMPENKEALHVSKQETTQYQKILQEAITYTTPTITEVTIESEIMEYSDSEVQKTPPNIVAPIVVNSENSKGYVNYNFDAKKAKVSENAYFRGNIYSKELQGQVSGVNVTTGSGQPGSDATIRIRGLGSVNPNTSPLYIIDGKPMSQTDLNNINPEDIGEVTVLKDTSTTAIYGYRGVNGVILIQTKKDLEKNGKRNVGENIKLEDIDKIFSPIDIDTESYENFTENQFESTQSNPVSTFSIDVDNASYTNIRRFINNGQAVPKDAVRIEEMVNFFKYEYPEPKDKQPFSIHTEYSDAPWNPNHKLLKIGLQGKEIPTNKLPKSNFVFLVDVSGSMNAPNKLPLLKSSMKVLLDELRDDDRVSIVYYANNVGVLLEPTKAKEKKKIIEVIDNMTASGGTSGGAGLELAYEMAEKHFVKGGNNRIILATDGDFNIGKSSDTEMQQLIEKKRKSGVFLTCLGFGMGNYKDSKMITLSKKGNGNYAYIDNIQEANRFLGKEFKGSMYAIAKDVKIQIEFNPAHVQAYRLIGYEMRKLRNEDFTNDAIDAGELGSGHTVTALYEVIPNGVKSEFYAYESDLKYTQTNPVAGMYQNELATIKFRYKKPDGDKSIEMVHTIPNQKITLQNASKDFKFAGAVAWFGLKLRDSQLIPNKESKEIIKLAKDGLHKDVDGYKAEFIRLVKSVK